MLISNFHCAPNSQNPPKGSPGHDPLHKIRLLVRMCQDNFHLKYRPGRFYLSMKGAVVSEVKSIF